MITKEDMTEIEHNELVIEAYQKLVVSYEKENLELSRESTKYCLNVIAILNAKQKIRAMQKLLDYRMKALREDQIELERKSNETNDNFDKILYKIRSNPKYSKSERLKKLLSDNYDLTNQNEKNRLYSELILECQIIDKGK